MNDLRDVKILKQVALFATPIYRSKLLNLGGVYG